MTPGCNNRRSAAEARAKTGFQTYDEKLGINRNRGQQTMKKASNLVDAKELADKLEATPLADSAIRGIPVTVLQEYGVRVSSNGGKLIFPLTDDKGFLHRVKWRLVEKQQGQQSFGSSRCTDAPAPLFGLKAASNDRALYITEGEIDAMSIRAMIPNASAVSIPDGASSALQAVDNHLSWIKRFGTVFICFDSDEAGNTAAASVLTKYPEFKRVIMPSGYKDANDVLKKGKDAVELFKKATYQARSQEPDYLDDWDVIAAGVVSDLANPEKAIGLDTGIYPLNALLGGWRHGETSCIFAPPGKGKSTMCRTLVYQQAKRGINSVVISTEESAKAWVRNLTIIHTGRLDASAVHQTAEFLRQYVTFLNPDTLGEPDRLTSALENTVRAKNAFLVLLDNITHYAKSLQGDYWNTIRYLTNKLISTAKRYECHILVIGHITKSAARAEEPNLADADGGNSLAQFLHNVLHIDRYKAPKDEEDDGSQYVPVQPEMTTTITLLKRREEPYGVELPSVGAKEYITYNPKAKTYLELAKPRSVSKPPQEVGQANTPEETQDSSQTLLVVSDDVIDANVHYLDGEIVRTLEGDLEVCGKSDLPNGHALLLEAWKQQGKTDVGALVDISGVGSSDSEDTQVTNAEEFKVLADELFAETEFLKSPTLPKLTERELEIIANAKKESGTSHSQQNQNTAVRTEDAANDRQSTRKAGINSILEKLKAAKSPNSSSGAKKSAAKSDKTSKSQPSILARSRNNAQPQPGLPAEDANGQDYRRRMQERWQRAREARKTSTRMVQGIIGRYQAGEIDRLPWESGQLSLSNIVVTPSGQEVLRVDGYQLLPPASFISTVGLASANNEAP